ncbi:MAG TPA: hypothetical protein VGJ45_25545 [Pseudonocardiaceae bacterium]
MYSTVSGEVELGRDAQQVAGEALPVRREPGRDELGEGAPLPLVRAVQQLPAAPTYADAAA